MEKSQEVFESETHCYGPVPEGWYVSNITPWSHCPGGFQMTIVKLGAKIIRCSSTHAVPTGYVVTQLVQNSIHYDGMYFDLFVCEKLGAASITMCACMAVPEGYVLEREINWSPCTGARYCTSGRAYVIRKLIP